MSDEAIPWWQDPRIRTQLTMYVPTLLLGIKAIFKVDLTPQLDLIVNLLLALIASIGWLIAVIRRVREGNVPANPALPIQAPKVVDLVQRLTK